MRVRSILASLAAGLGLLGAFALGSPDAHAGADPAVSALKEEQVGRTPYNVVQNRFFLKSERFEVAPFLGYVPNNPFVKRYVGGAMLAYHLSETFAIEGAVMYAPDLGESDLKGLTETLVQIAEEGGSGVGFQQPLDKLVLGATFSARWTPIYGKINLIGERVLNFDLYGTGGLGFLSIAGYYARYDEDRVNNDLPPAALTERGNSGKPAVNIGVGFDFFFTGSLALKLDTRSLLYVSKAPQYDPNGDPNALPSRLYNDFVASVGLSIFFPSMQPRIYNF